MSLYADVINTYTLKYMTYFRKNRFEQDTNEIDAEFNVLMCVFDKNKKLQNCTIKTICLPVYPGGGMNYRQRNVKIGSIDIPNISAPVLECFVWRRATSGKSDSLSAVKDAGYIKNYFEPEFPPLVLSEQSRDNEIKSISLDGEYGYVNHDRNKIKFVFTGTHNTAATPSVIVAQDASVECSGTLAEGNLSYTVTSAGGDKRTYAVVVEDSYTTAFAEDFSASKQGDSSVESLTLTDKGGSTAFRVGGKTEDSSDMALYVSKNAKGTSGGIMVNPKVLSGTGYIKKSLFKFDIKIKSEAATSNFAWYAGSEVLGIIARGRTANGVSDKTKYSFGTRFNSKGNEAGLAGNSVFTGTTDKWDTFAVLGSMQKQSYDNMPIGHTAHQYIEVYNIVNNVPVYLGEYFIFDRNKNKDDNANQALGAVCYSSYIDDLNGFNKAVGSWGFGLASSATTGEFGLDNISILRKQ